MGAKFAAAHPVGTNVIPDLRRYAGAIHVVSAFLGASIAGLLLMAPLDLADHSEVPTPKLDLVVLNVPRAAAAGAVFAVVAAALALALGRRAAWIAAFGSIVSLAMDHLLVGEGATTGTLTTVNYLDSIFSGILLGALAGAVFPARVPTTAFLIGALASIVVGDQTALPAGEHGSVMAWAANGTPPLWFLGLTIAVFAVSVALRWHSDEDEDADTDLPIGPIVAALLMVFTNTVLTESLVRYSGATERIVVAAVITVLVALGAALLLPGRDGVLVLLALAVANAGSAVIAVPRPDWTTPLPVLAIIAGLAAGRRWRSPWYSLTGTALLAVFAALGASIAHDNPVIPVLGITLTGLLIGYCFAVALPASAPNAVVSFAVLIVPCLVMALRGNDFGQVAYSPRLYRDPYATSSAAPGWLALAITAGCAAALWMLYRLRPAGAIQRVAAPVAGPPD